MSSFIRYCIIGLGTVLTWLVGTVPLCAETTGKEETIETQDSRKETKEERTFFRLLKNKVKFTASPEELARARKAEELMQHVFHYVKEHNLDSAQFTSDVYLRHFMRTRRKGPIVRYIPGMLRLERGINNYLSEARLRFQFRPPGEIDCKVTAYHTTARYQKAQRLTSMGRFNFQIYDSKLFLDCILNPLNHRNRKFYRYTYSFTTQLNDSTAPSARIQIRPRFANDQLVEGYIDINTETGAVKNFFFRLQYQLQTIYVNGRTGEEGYETLLPCRLRIISNFHLLGNQVYEVTDVFSRHVFSCPLPTTRSKRSRLDLSNECLLRVDTTRTLNSQAYFDTIRPIPLRGIEKELLNEWNQEPPNAGDDQRPSNFKEGLPTIQDSILPIIQQVPDLPHEEAKQDARPQFFGERTQNILLSSHHFNLGEHSRLKLPAIITPSMVGWSRNKGFSLKTRIQWEYYGRQPHLQPLFEIRPSIGYSFKQKQIYWEVPFLVRFLPQFDGSFYFNANGGAHMYSSRQADELRKKLEGIEKYDSLLHIIDHYGFHDYRDSQIKTDFSLSPLPGLRLSVGTRYHRRGMIDWNKVAAATKLMRHFSTIGPHVQVEWTPSQYYYREGKRRIPLYSHYPTFRLNYERGFALGRGATHYERLETDAHYRLPLYAMRSLYFRVGGGVFTQRGKDCFLDYDYFKFSYMPDEWNDDLTGEFQLLNARWYNESRYYLRFTGTYESPMLLFSRMPYISRVVQKERVYLNLLTVRSLGFYSEVGYGISTHLLDLGAFVGIAPDRSIDFGCKVVLKFFEN